MTKVHEPLNVTIPWKMVGFHNCVCTTPERSLVKYGHLVVGVPVWQKKCHVQWLRHPSTWTCEMYAFGKAETPFVFQNTVDVSKTIKDNNLGQYD